MWVNYDAPVTSADAYSTDEDAALSVGAPGVLSNDTDPDGDSMTVTVISPPSDGTLTLNLDGSFTYTPDPDFNGADGFTYSADDGNGGTTTETVTLDVESVNDGHTTSAESWYSAPILIWRRP